MTIKTVSDLVVNERPLGLEALIALLTRVPHLPALSNACFFNMGARLARFTGNSTFAKTSEDTWDWLTNIGFVDNETWAVYDGAHVDHNCTDISKVQFSANAAMLTQGAAFMYNFVSFLPYIDRALGDLERC
jgi:hypothetical protein